MLKKINLFDWRYQYILFLLLIGSIIPWIQEFNLLSLMYSFCFAVLQAVFISFIGNLIFRGKWHDIYTYIIAVLINLMIVTDITMLCVFGLVFDENAYNIIRNTNFEESKEFLITYFSIKTIGIFLCALVINYLLVKLAKLIAKKTEKIKWPVASAAIIMSVIFITYQVLSFLDKVPDISILNFSITTRYMRPIIIPEDVYITKSLIDQGNMLKGNVKSEPTDSTIYIMILGESHSKFHSQLYGYKYDTQPKMQELADNDELIVFNDCISMYDCTGAQLRSIFSYGPDNKDVTHTPIFPQVFKAAGYTTRLFDNEYLAEVPVVYYSEPELTAQCFDYRIDRVYDYDEDMVDVVDFNVPRSLTILHLKGEHYVYDDRMPKTYPRRFNASQYTEYDESQRQIIANYDNCLTYTDSLLSVVIEQLRDKDACVMYFSDHGEEVYEVADYMGHGTAINSSDPNYQIRVPFFIWGSETFRQNPKWLKLQQRADYPITTNDYSHFITDLAGIEFDKFEPKRSFINDAYDTSTHRKVLKGWDYEDYVKPMHKK